MGLGGFFWFFTPEGQFRRRLQNIRKKWDRMREKVDRKNYPSRLQLLERLDRVEQDIRTIEEKEDLNLWVKKKMANEVELELEKIRDQMRGDEIGQKSEVGEIEKKIKNYA